MKSVEFMNRTTNKTRQPWYVCGLHFECLGCGNCCAGPGEGYIWITKPEIARLAAFLGLTTDELRRKYLASVGPRTTIVEHQRTKDCIFLTDTPEGRGCAVYRVRPNQCRTWPFWSANLQTADDWNMAGIRCPGINRGRFYSFDETETIRRQTQWWQDDVQA